MNPKWHILFCDERLQGCPVVEFIAAAPPHHRVKILRFLGLLEEHGPTLPRPYADLLTEGIHELRIHLSGEQVRLLYFFCHRKFIILYHAFVKTTQRVPERFIRQVRDYRDTFLASVTPADLEEVVHAHR